MVTLLLKWLCSFFTADKIGILVRMLLINTGSLIAKDILNPENQKKALEFVKELAKREDLSNKEKAAVFNEKMIDFAKKSGKVLADSVINCLREFAVNAFKAQQAEEAEESK